MKTGIELIAQERIRQIEVEGFDSAHDCEHTNGELAGAGACYALYFWSRTDAERLFPWKDWFKPSETDRIRNLVKAGALIAAEIDRLQFSEEAKRIYDNTKKELGIEKPEAK